MGFRSSGYLRRLAAIACLAGPLLVGCTIEGPARLETVHYLPVQLAADDQDCFEPKLEAPVAGPRSYPEQPGVFAGVLRGKSETIPVGRVRYIFHTHGMGRTRRCEDFTDLLLPLLAARGYRLSEPASSWIPAELPAPVHVRGEAFACAERAAKQPPCYYTTFGDYRVDRLNGPGGDTVVVYSYYWDRDLWQVQLPFMNDDLHRNPGWLSAKGKDIVNGGLSDAAAYLGPMGDPLRAGMGRAVCAMLRDAAGLHDKVSAPATMVGCLSAEDARALRATPVQFSFISHSLGSRMLFDVLSPAAGDPSGGVLIDRTATFLMAANQLPLLGTGRVTTSLSAPATGSEGADKENTLVAAAADCDRLPGFLAAKCGAEARRYDDTKRRLVQGLPAPARSAEDVPTLDVVGFVDPSDLLGFRVSGGMAGAHYPGVSFQSVVHRNTPKILGLGADPTQAHDHELQRKGSAAMFLCGAMARGARLVPRQCGAP